MKHLFQSCLYSMIVMAFLTACSHTPPDRGEPLPPLLPDKSAPAVSGYDPASAPEDMHYPYSDKDMDLFSSPGSDAYLQQLGEEQEAEEPQFPE